MAWNVTRQDLEQFVSLDPRRAQELLPELVGKLIKASVDPKFFRFPKGNDIYLPGFDGELESDVHTTFIPEGRSVWQVSVRHDFWVKSNEDIKGKDPNPNATYVQLFIHEWQSRASKSDLDWIDSVGDHGWKEVRVISGTQLIDWIDSCPAVHRWIASVLGKRTEKHIDAQEGWNFWANETKIACEFDLIINDREYNLNQFTDALLNDPCSINIIGESVSDSLGFVYSAICSNDYLTSRFLDVRKSHTVLDIYSSPTKLILLVDARTEGIGYALKVRNHHIIHLQDKNDYYNADVTIKLNPVSFASRQSALCNMGFKNKQAFDIVDQSSNKLDFIRIHPDLGPYEVNKFEWMKIPEFTNLLKAFTIINFLRVDSEDEIKILSNVCNLDAESVRTNIEKLIHFENSPLRQFYNIIEVESPIILWPLFPQNYFSGYELMYLFADIFGFDLPKFTNSPDKKDYGNVSMEFKEKAIDGLRMVSFKLSTEAGLVDANISEIDIIIKSIIEITPVEQMKRFLISLSEISPKFILDFIAKHQSQDFKDFIDNMNGNDFTLFTSLEMIGQHPLYLPRVSKLLWTIANLHDNEVTISRAINSISNLHFPHNPMTSASVVDRAEVIKQLISKDDDRTWQLILALLPSNGPRYILSPFKPKWKNWLRGRRNPSNEEVNNLINELVNIAIQKASSDSLIRWADIIMIMPLLPEASFNSCVTNLNILLSKTKDNIDIYQTLKSELKVLVDIYTSNTRKIDLLPPEKFKMLQSLIDRDYSDDPLDECFYVLTAWHPQIDGIDERMDRSEKNRILENKKIHCLRTVYNTHGINGLEKIVQHAKNPTSLWKTFDEFEEFKTNENLFRWLKSDNADLERIAGQLISWITNREKQWLIKNREDISKLNPKHLIRLLNYSDLSAGLFKIIKLNLIPEEQFWQNRHSFYIHPNNYEIIDKVVSSLLIHNRFYSCIECLNTIISIDHNVVDPNLVVRVLTHDDTKSSVNERHLNHGLYSTWINNLINYLNHHNINETLMVQIEWDHFESIESNHSMPAYTLSKILSDPIYFVEKCVDTKKEEVQATETWKKVRDENRLTNIYALLAEFEQTASLLTNFEQLDNFVNVAIQHSENAGISKVIHNKIGRLLSHSPADPTDDFWPSIAVRDVLENVNSIEVENGFIQGIVNPDIIGVHNSYYIRDHYKQDFLRYMSMVDKLNVRYPNTSRLIKIIADYYQHKNSEFNKQLDQ